MAVRPFCHSRETCSELVEEAEIHFKTTSYALIILKIMKKITILNVSSTDYAEAQRAAPYCWCEYICDPYVCIGAYRCTPFLWFQ
jgi:hypothetical protein